MREIKFRAWNKAQNIIYHNAQNTYDFNCYNYGGCPEDNFKEVIENDDYILMQYTGMKDKNGKEIYEGDILECELYDKTYDNYVVCYDEIQGCYVAENKEGGKIYYQTWEEQTVIGNKFENPELLNAYEDLKENTTKTVEKILDLLKKEKYRDIESMFSYDILYDDECMCYVDFSNNERFDLRIDKLISMKNKKE